jgi:hypothetical protein
MTSNESREALRVAQCDREAASAALVHARETADRARDLLEGIVRDGEALEAFALRAAGAMAEAMRAAFLDGTSPPAAMSEKDHSKAAAARASNDLRRQAAEAIVADFAGAERDVEEAVVAARAAVDAAIQAIVRSEIESLAAEWAEIDAKARALRARLGDAYGPTRLLRGLGEDVARAVEQNSHDRVDLGETASVMAVWNDFAAGLAQDPETTISFAPVDRAREDAKAARERSHASDDEIQVQLAQMRARPASPEPDDEWTDHQMAIA